ncbi:OadG family transporter subunit [Mangrovibacterium marinum]|uniref:Na+-transporting methylmalonyl-CoA/oxaloacetate decarboxylase gamma subunit n=1 Tax=Mangrovibacterium marinum TaxID=1639118 RepID=A0A2T5BY43_9BACT|nr:OadG family transporter subunit [Mangrovibacterium marinum]PTN06757.1 Na+-transporting methylmalonyl-CoA/oxaloacetate decarboxylase gamma subunit [Mangrovibacterium marinum]
MQRKSKALFAGIFVLLFVAFSHALYAQGATNLKFNEILLNNESNFMDEYGQRSSWLEIVNSSYSKVNIGGCYLTDDQKNPKKYWIPNNSQETVISPRGFIVFFADGKPSRGIFHLNFHLEAGKSIYLYDANGRTLVDQVTLPDVLAPDLVYYRQSIDSDQWATSAQSTPRSDNDHSHKASAGERFVEHDPIGVGMVIVAMSVVFSALAILFLFYLLVGRKFKAKKKAKSAAGEHKQAPEEHLSGEVNAAIAMALHLHFAEQHDFENTVLTIKKVARPYSPWSSKIYTLRKHPRQ